MDDLTGDSPTLASQLAGVAALVAGRYRVRARLGRGASKEVYLAYDVRLDREVALAIVVGAGTAAARARVAREAQVTGRLGDHPNVITVYDTGEHDGLPYLVLRAMPGGSLADLLQRERPSFDEAIRLGSEIAGALAHAHANDVVHRDVKPDNVWLATDGSAALGDFGIAQLGGSDRLTREGTVVGTARYLSPEQATGAEIGPASDLYSLGVTLYELVTGRTPFASGGPASLLAQHIATAPDPPTRHNADVPLALERLILDLLAKDPADRPPTATAVIQALESIAASNAPPGGADAHELVGREVILARLSAAWDEALSGRPRIVAMTGEPGIGKTRCADELVQRAARGGAAVGRGVCSDQDGSSAFWPWIRALRTLAAADEQLLGGDGPAQPEGASVEEARFRLFDAVAGQLEHLSTQRPILVVLEDIHWADRSSIELIVHVARELRRARLLVVLTYRGGELADAHALRRGLAEMARIPAFERLELRGLTQENVASYVELATGSRPTRALATALHERTRGNPFFVSEVVRLLSEDGRVDERGPILPAAVRDVVRARLERLAPATRALVETAAVAGQEFRVQLVASAARVGRGDLLEALEPATAQQLVSSPVRDVAHFEHAIVRDVVYDALAPSQRALMHGRIGVLLQDRRARGQPQPAAEIAHHLLGAARAGGDPEPALAASVEAAGEAIKALAHAEAAEHFEAALEAADLADVASDEERAHLLLDLAKSRRNAGDIQEARRRYGEAAELLRDVGTPQLFATATLGFAEFVSYGGIDHAAIDLLGEVLVRLPQGDDPTRARLLGLLAIRLDPDSEQSRREAVLDEAIAMARRLSDTAVLARLLAFSTIVHWAPASIGRRSAAATETIALGLESGDTEAVLWAHSMRYDDFFGAGDIAAADTELAAYAQLAAELHQPYYRWWLTVMQATRAIFAGELAEGRRLATDAVEHNRAHEPDPEQEYAVQMLMLALAEDRIEAVDATVLRGFAAQYPDLAMWRAIVAYVDLARGDRDGARASFEALADAGFAQPSRDPDAISTLSFAAEICAGLGDAARSAILYDLLLPFGDRNVLVERGWGAWGAAAHQLGLLAATSGDTDVAARHLGRALELNRRWRARPWEQRTLRAADRLGIALG